MTRATPSPGGTKPLIEIGLASDDGAVIVVAVVDSGASKSLFPKEVAYELGLTDDDLIEDALPSGGVGSSFRTWSSTVEISAQVVATLEGGPQRWGPMFAVAPAFTEFAQGDPAFLLGREDFFRAFRSVTFMENAPMSAFILDY